MTRLVRAELLKLRTMRVTYGLLAAAAAVTALFSSLQASGAGRSVPPVSTAAGLSDVTTVGGVAMILAAVLGVIVTSGEFRHTNVTLTYLATPDRRRVLGAKAIATAFVGACYGLAAGIVATAVGLAFVAAHGNAVTVGAATMIAHIAGAGAGARPARRPWRRRRLAHPGAAGRGHRRLGVVHGDRDHPRRQPQRHPSLPALHGRDHSRRRQAGAGAFGPGYSISSQQALPFLAAAALLAAVAAAVAAIASPHHGAPGRHMTASEVIENPISGERITIRETAAQTGGELLAWELELAPADGCRASHAHPGSKRPLPSRRTDAVPGRWRRRSPVRGTRRRSRPARCTASPTRVPPGPGRGADAARAGHAGPAGNSGGAGPRRSAPPAPGLA